MRRLPRSLLEPLVEGARDLLVRQPKQVVLLRLTLLLLVLYGGRGWQLGVPIRLLCGAMLLCPSLTVSTALWALVSASMVLYHADHWYSADNHKYLMCYWCFACTLSTAMPRPHQLLAFHGRSLIAICFLCATVWKLWAGEYLDGSFLRFTMLTDGRMNGLCSMLTGISRESLEDNSSVLFALAWTGQEGDGIALATNRAAGTWSLLLSWWTLLIESSIAISFLLPSRWRVSRIRDWQLITFVATTYVILPVLGFAFALSILGFAQCEQHRKAARLTYLVLFVVVQLAGLPIDTYVGELASRG